MASQERDEEFDEEALEGLTPEERAIILAMDAEIRERQQEAEPYLKALKEGGWKWSKEETSKMVHPQDEELFIHYDPFTAKLILSPKLAKLTSEYL